MHYYSVHYLRLVLRKVKAHGLVKQKDSAMEIPSLTIISISFYSMKVLIYTLIYNNINIYQYIH